LRSSSSGRRPVASVGRRWGETSRPITAWAALIIGTPSGPGRGRKDRVSVDMRQVRREACCPAGELVGEIVLAGPGTAHDGVAGGEKGTSAADVTFERILPPPPRGGAAME